MVSKYGKYQTSTSQTLDVALYNHYNEAMFKITLRLTEGFFVVVFLCVFFFYFFFLIIIIIIIIIIIT
jgi:hypothetical protein